MRHTRFEAPKALVDYLAQEEASRLAREEHDAAVSEFWSYVDIRGGRECWPWMRACGRAGYGVLTPKLAKLLGERAAHRVAVRMHDRRRPGRNLIVLHSCDNPPCCNPRHLRWGTNEQNSMDAFIARWSRLALESKLAGERTPTELEARGVFEREDRTIRGEQHHKAKITAAIVVEIRSMYDAGVATGVIAAKFGLSPSHVNSVGDRQTWRHVQ